MFRRYFGALAFVVLAASCSVPASTPLAPLPALPAITGLTVTTDTTRVAFPFGPVQMTIRVQTQGGQSAFGHVAHVTYTLDGAASIGNDVPLSADGSATQTYNFTKPGSLRVAAGSFSQAILISQDAPPALPTPPSGCNPCAPPSSPPAPTLRLTASSDNYLPSVNQTVRLTATATSSDGVTPSTAQIEWDLDANGTTDFISPPGATAAITGSFPTSGPKTVIVRVRDSQGRWADTTIRLQVQ